MGRFVNTETKVVVSVADDKDERFASPLWEAYDGSEPTTGDEAAATAGKRRTGAARAAK